jgi:hypothetical protein
MVVVENRKVKNADMSGPVEEAIRAHITPGTCLPTPTGRAEFVVHELSSTMMVLLLGAKQTRRSPIYELCAAGGLGFVRRSTSETPTSTNESAWLPVRAAEDLWWRILSGQAR